MSLFLRVRLTDQDFAPYGSRTHADPGRPCHTARGQTEAGHTRADLNLRTPAGPQAIAGKPIEAGEKYAEARCRAGSRHHRRI
ncbi:hypothetical protein BH24GEM2_BH24GEM2_19100 [soil metagenome]